MSRARTPLASGPRRRGDRMKRRVFITGLAGAAVVGPHGALAQRQMPLVGFLNGASPDTYRFNANSFREGLAQAGFVEGKNVTIEERWARGDYHSRRLRLSLSQWAQSRLQPPAMSLLLVPHKAQ